MIKRWSSKTPAEIKDDGIDWTDRLPLGDTLASSFWVVEPIETDGIVIDSDDLSELSTSVWLSGGTAGERYTLKNTVTTMHGRTLEMCVYIFVVVCK